MSSQNGSGIPINPNGKRMPKNNSIEDTLKEEQRIIEQEKQNEKAKKEKSSKNGKIAAISAVSGLLLLGVAGGVLFDPLDLIDGDPIINLNGNNNDNSNDENNNNSDSNGDGDSVSYDLTDEENKQLKDSEVKIDTFYEDKKPVPISEWQNKVYDPNVSVLDQNDEFISEVSGDVQQSSVWSAAGTLPSEEAGFVSDIDKATNEDGTLNSYFSYWTQENFSYELATKVARLLNPTFGGWGLYQYSDYSANGGFDVAPLSDMFTPEYLAANEGKPHSEWVPVFADWNGNDYGMGDQLLSNGDRWYGQIVSDNTVFEFNEETMQYTAVYEADVKFTAWTQNQDTVEKTGHLTLNLVSGENYPNAGANRVLINGASLTVN